ncbi:unnamed protein product [Leuciscus chuanchicus]
MDLERCDTTQIPQTELQQAKRMNAAASAFSGGKGDDVKDVTRPRLQQRKNKPGQILHSRLFQLPEVYSNRVNEEFWRCTAVPLDVYVTAGQAQPKAPRALEGQEEQLAAAETTVHEDLNMKNMSIYVCPGPTVKPSVSLLPPSSLQISGDSAALLCLLSSYSPQGALVSWTLDGSEVTEGVLTSAESQQDGRYSRSSVLTLSKARWEEGELYVCRVTHDGAPHEVSFHKSSEC